MSVTASDGEGSRDAVTNGRASDVSSSPVTSRSEAAVSEVGDAINSPLAQRPVNPSTESKSVVPVYDILDYIRSTFDDATVLDSLPVEAAGNPGAWHAWRAHRRGASDSGYLKRGSPQARLPGDWHWDGIWARRVQEEIENSHSEQMLFGSASRGTDEMVRNLLSLSLS